MTDFKIDKNWYNNLTEKYNCPYCSKEYSKKGISTHILRTHLNIDSFKNIDNHKKNYKHEKSMCNKCNKEFSNYYMEKHKENCNNEIIYICECCGKQTNVKFGSGRFCSRICANKRVHSQKTKEKISNGIKERISSNIEYIQKNSNKIKVSKKDKDNIPNILKNKKDLYNLNLLNRDFDSLKFELIKKRILLEQNNECNNCHISEWNNKPLTLELEHKDGNHNNNLRENLECLCPNCHSQTETWRGRNQKRKQNKISDESLLLSFYKNNNIRQTLLDLNMAAKGKNYDRIKSVLTKHGINYKNE